ncbi:MAG: amidohydrolase family protein, partial [Deltaproteobacteria bacterium]|nr:amidohydrolase family protein [Deltaproteobacteria bacterium]
QSILRDHKGIDYIKIVQSGLNSLTRFGMESSPQFDQEELREAVRVGERMGLGVMVHANGRLPVRSAIEAGCNSIEHGFFMGDENLAMMAEKRIVWVPTVFTMEACSRIFRHGSIEYDTARRNLEHQLSQIFRALDYGVLIAAGTDSGSPGVHHGLALVEEIRLFISAGLSLVAAIRCATSNGARLLGLEGEAGTLKQGMPATFVVIKGGPEGLPGSLEFPEAVYVRGRAKD